MHRMNGKARDLSCLHVFFFFTELRKKSPREMKKLYELRLRKKEKKPTKIIASLIFFFPKTFVFRVDILILYFDTNFNNV